MERSIFEPRALYAHFEYASSVNRVTAQFWALASDKAHRLGITVGALSPGAVFICIRSSHSADVTSAAIYGCDGSYFLLSLVVIGAFNLPADLCTRQLSFVT